MPIPAWGNKIASPNDIPISNSLAPASNNPPLSPHYGRGFANGIATTVRAAIASNSSIRTIGGAHAIGDTAGTPSTGA